MYRVYLFPFRLQFCSANLPKGIIFVLSSAISRLNFFNLAIKSHDRNFWLQFHFENNIRNHPHILPCTLVLYRLFEQLSQTISQDIMKIDICKYWRYDASLRSSYFCFIVLSLLPCIHLLGI